MSGVFSCNNYRNQVRDSVRDIDLIRAYRSTDELINDTKYLNDSPLIDVILDVREILVEEIINRFEKGVIS